MANSLAPFCPKQAIPRPAWERRTSGAWRARGGSIADVRGEKDPGGRGGLKLKVESSKRRSANGHRGTTQLPAPFRFGVQARSRSDPRRANDHRQSGWLHAKPLEHAGIVTPLPFRLSTFDFQLLWSSVDYPSAPQRYPTTASPRRKPKSASSVWAPTSVCAARRSPDRLSARRSY